MSLTFTFLVTSSHSWSVSVLMQGVPPAAAAATFGFCLTCLLSGVTPG